MPRRTPAARSLPLGMAGSDSSSPSRTPPGRRSPSPRDEADLSAQEATPRQGAWLPRAHEDPGWAPGAGGAASQGTQAPDSLTGDALPAGTRRREPERLRSANDFAALQRSGRTRGDALILVRFRANQEGRTRFGFATGRKLGGAVVRNRIRRRLRSILRSLGPRLAAGWDVLIVVRPAAVPAPQTQLGSSIERALRAAGVLQGEETDR